MSAHADYCSIATSLLDELLELPNLRLYHRKRYAYLHYYYDEEAQATIADEGYGFEVDRWDEAVEVD